MKKTILTIIFILLTYSPVQAQTFINKVTVGLGVYAQDDGAGIGQGSMMQFSNDGLAWSIPEPYSSNKPNWNLDSYGGDPSATIKTVYMKVSDMLGNWSGTIPSDQVTIDNKGPTGSVLIELTVIIGQE